MSFNKRSNNVNANTKKPFCKVCQDAGKPESEYTSHFVKSLEGKVICPTLLSLECRYCFQAGHTVKFCSVLAEKKKAEESAKRQELRAIKAESKPVETGKTKVSNKFASLYNDDCADSDDEITSDQLPKEEFPALPTLAKKQIYVPAKVSYATTLAKPKAEVKTVLPAISVDKQPTRSYADDEAPAMPKQIVVQKPKISVWEMDWAEPASDSDSDDENW